MFGNRHQLALHDAAGRFLRIGKRVFDCGAVLGIELCKDSLLVILFQILDDRNCVIGIQLSGKVGNLRRL